MQVAIEFAPWIIFGLVYKFGGGLYPATVALMIAIVIPLAYGWLRERKVGQMHLVLAILVWVFGAATLILHDVRFLQWKASVYYWLCGLAIPEAEISAVEAEAYSDAMVNNRPIVPPDCLMVEQRDSAPCPA